VLLLSRHGALTERSLSSKMPVPTKSLRIVLRNMQKDGEVRIHRSRWELFPGVTPEKPELEVNVR